MLKEGMFLQGRYEIVGRIGSGGMADVYKAKDHKLNRFVAVKVLKPEFRDDKAFITKFRAEAQAAAGLTHPNIVNIYDVGEEKGIYFIVMELVEGITLKEYIAKKGKLAVREATSIAIQVSQGLEAAHNNGIVHRDIKPQNIIISTDGKVKVTDFGIARATNSNTISTTVMGSVHYSSPEQARGGYSDAKSDIYSLGITMYEMLTGRVPFDGDTTVAIAIKHLQEEMVPPSVYVQDLPRSIVQIINKCTQKSSDRRYANMEEVIRDLKESLVHPDGDFVQITNGDNGGKTVVISREELGAIKEGYANTRKTEPSAAPMGQNPYQGGQGTVPQGYQGMPGAPGGNGYDPYAYGMDSRAYGNRGYDYQEDLNRKKRLIQEEEEDRDSILNPKLEKLMTVGSIVIAVLILFVFAGLIANALGIFKFSMPGSTGSNNKTTVTGEKTTEKQKDIEKEDTDTIWQEETLAVYETEKTEDPEEEKTQETEAVQTEPETELVNNSDTVDIPSVEGMDYDSAVNALMGAGFYVSRQDNPSNDYPEGTVMEQSMYGSAKPGSTVILIVSAGPEEEQSGTWMCNAQLEAPEGYNGQAAMLVLEQNGVQTTIFDGSPISFPYDLVVTGQQGVTTGSAYLYVYNEVTGGYDFLASYDNIPFSQVN
ncbi:MAG: Stk1 family PASTA domain-containing Ser/Thr kinase [Muricoprocola sp.]